MTPHWMTQVKKKQLKNSLHDLVLLPEYSNWRKTRKVKTQVNFKNGLDCSLLTVNFVKVTFQFSLPAWRVRGAATTDEVDKTPTFKREI